MKIAELRTRDPRRFERLYEAWCEHEPWDEWPQSIYEWAAEEGERRGFMIDVRTKRVPGATKDDYSIYWSGFWSQGDGASWVGHVDIPKWIEWMRAERQRELDAGPCRPGNGTPFTDEQLLWIDQGYEIDWLKARMHIRAGSGYSHSGTMKVVDDSVWDEAAVPDDEVPSGVFQGMSSDAFVFSYGQIVDTALHDEAIKAARAFADEIYTMLEEEYEYLASEEQFMESVQDEEYDDEE